MPFFNWKNCLLEERVIKGDLVCHFLIGRTVYWKNGSSYLPYFPMRPFISQEEVVADGSNW